MAYSLTPPPILNTVDGSLSPAASLVRRFRYSPLLPSMYEDPVADQGLNYSA